jgi:hypothetical protein
MICERAKKKSAEHQLSALSSLLCPSFWAYEVSCRARTGSVLRNANLHYASPRVPLSGTLVPPRRERILALLRLRQTIKFQGPIRLLKMNDAIKHA